MPKKKAKPGKPAPSKAGRPPTLDAELVAGALVELKGNLSAVARRFGVHRSSVQELIGKRAGLQALLADARESRLDAAEDSLDRAVGECQGWAVCFILKTLGKSRGYVERQELSGPNGSPLPVAFIEIPQHAADRGSDPGREAGPPLSSASGPVEGVE